jgi:hypothetical protein
MPAPVSRQQQKWAFGAMGASWARLHHFDQPISGSSKGRSKIKGVSRHSHAHSHAQAHRRRRKRH